MPGRFFEAKAGINGKKLLCGILSPGECHHDLSATGAYKEVSL